MKAQWQEQLRKDMQAVQLYTWERIGDHDEAEQREAIVIYKSARLLHELPSVKQHELSIEDISLLLDSFPFVTAEEVIDNLVLEKDKYYIAASTVNAGYDVWEFWRDNSLRLPHWYGVAKNIALIQPSSAFMKRVFSILRSCMDERQEKSFSDRIAASALLKYNRGRGK